MSRFRSKPSEIEAVRYGKDDDGRWYPGAVQRVAAFIAGLDINAEMSDGEVSEYVRPATTWNWSYRILIRAGEGSIQEWIPVPLGYWIVRSPGDLTDHRPVDPDYFTNKYEPVDAVSATIREKQVPARDLRPGNLIRDKVGTILRVLDVDYLRLRVETPSDGEVYWIWRRSSSLVTLLPHPLDQKGDGEEAAPEIDASHEHTVLTEEERRILMAWGKHFSAQFRSDLTGDYNLVLHFSPDCPPDCPRSHE